MSIKYEKILKEDLDLGYGTASRTAPNGGTMTGNKIGIHTFTGIYNIKDFGAIGDGVSDDTDAFTDAIAAFGTRPGIILCPPGTYLVTSIDVNNRIVIEGVSTGLEDEGATSYGTVIKISTTGTGISLTAPRAGLRNLVVWGDVGNTADGVKFLANSNFLSNVSVLSMGGSGIVIGDASSVVNANSWRLYDVISRNNTLDGLLIDDLDSGIGPDANGGACFGLTLQNNGRDGLRIDNGEVNNFYGMMTEGNTGIGVHVMSNAYNNSFWATHSESNAGGNFIFDAGSANNSLVGGHNFVAVDNGSNAILKLGYGGILTDSLDIMGTSIGASFSGINIKDDGVDRVKIGYTSTPLSGTKIVPVQVTYGNVLASGDLELGSRGTVASNIMFYTSPDAGTTGLVEAVRITSAGQLQSLLGSKIGSSGTGIAELNWGTTASVADGATITHGSGSTPTAIIAVPSVAGEIVAVNTITSTTFKVEIKKHDNSAGTTQTIYWMVLR